MRRGEVLGLRWQDLDLEAGRASIAQTVIVVGGYEVQFSEPKTARGSRMVALDPQTVRVLLEHRQRQMLERSLMRDAYVDNDLVFAKEDGPSLPSSGETVVPVGLLSLRARMESQECWSRWNWRGPAGRRREP